MSRAAANRAKVARHRAKLRALGLRPIQIWALDVTRPGFAEEARRQGRAVAESAHAQEDQDWVDGAATLWDEAAERA